MVELCGICARKKDQTQHSKYKNDLSRRMLRVQWKELKEGKELKGGIILYPLFIFDYITFLLCTLPHCILNKRPLQDAPLGTGLTIYEVENTPDAIHLLLR